MKAVVRATIKELKKSGMLRDPDDLILEDMSERLRRFFRGDTDIELGKALQEISGDYYFEIIPLHYKNGMTIDAIADYMRADRSTIIRNKKRLVLGIYRIME